VLNVVFALYRSLNGFVMFEVNEALDRVLFSEARDQPIPVFVDSSHKVARHPDRMPLGALAMM
jgi:hypothetical protein